MNNIVLREIADNSINHFVLVYWWTSVWIWTFFFVTAAAPSKRSSADGFSPRFLAVRVSFGSLPQQLCFHFPQCLAVWIKHWRTVADNSRQHFILVHIWLNHNLDPAIYVMEFLPLRYRSNCKSYEESAALAAVCTLFPVIQLKLDCIKCLKLLS